MSSLLLALISMFNIVERRLRPVMQLLTYCWVGLQFFSLKVLDKSDCNKNIKFLYTYYLCVYYCGWDK